MGKIGIAAGALLLPALGLPLTVDLARAQEGQAVMTRLVIRAVARDAKVIGDGVGGAQIRVVDAETGETLASGRQEGNTGSTSLIMSTPRTRGMSVYDTDGTAFFVAELTLTRPTLVNISALGPLNHPQAIQSATKKLLVMPGEHIGGDGVILELHGFIVEIQSPEPLTPVGRSFEVTTRVRMMCGCELTPGGLWDANRVVILARLLADGVVVTQSRLDYSGEASIFSGQLAVPGGLRERDLELEVLASDPATGNFGRHAAPLGATW